MTKPFDPVAAAYGLTQTHAKSSTLPPAERAAVERVRRFGQGKITQHARAQHAPRAKQFRATPVRRVRSV